MTLPVRDFTNADDMIAHYKAVNERLMHPVIQVREKPKPVFIAPSVPDLLKHFHEVKIDNVHTVFRPEKGPKGARKIIEWVAATHGFTADEILSERRSKPLIDARWQAIAIVRLVNPTWSLPKIGQVFGGRDHTTILNCLRKMGIVPPSKKERV